MSTASLDDAYQAVRVITVRVHLSLASYPADASLSIFAGESAEQERVAVLVGSDKEALNALPLSSSFTASAAYQTTYSDDLSQLASPVHLFEQVVLGSTATVELNSRSSSRRHFIATYSYAFQCPEGMDLVPRTTNPNLGTCVTPPPSVASSALKLILGIGLGLVGLVLVWLMFERYRRQQSQQLLLQAKSTSAGPVDESDANLERDEQVLLEQLQQIGYRKLLKEIVFEVASLASEIISMALNCGDRRASADRLRLGSSQLAIAIGAVCANGVSRVTNLMFMRRQAHEMAQTAYREAAPRNASLGGGAAAGLTSSPPSDLVGATPEAHLRSKRAEAYRRLRRLRIIEISLVLNSIPFIILNLIQYHNDTEACDLASSTRTLQASLAFSFILVGMKIQDLRDYPNQTRVIITVQLGIVQMKMDALHGQAKGRRRMSSMRPTEQAAQAAMNARAPSNVPSSREPVHVVKIPDPFPSSTPPLPARATTEVEVELEHMRARASASAE